MSVSTHCAHNKTIYVFSLAPAFVRVFVANAGLREWNSWRRTIVCSHAHKFVTANEGTNKSTKYVSVNNSEGT